MWVMLKPSLSLSVSPPLSPSFSVCRSLVLLVPGLSHMVDWSSRGVEANSVGEAQELRRVAAGAEISLSRLGRKHKHTSLPLLSSCLSLSLSFHHPPSWLGSAMEFTVSTGSPLHSHTSMGGLMNQEKGVGKESHSVLVPFTEQGRLWLHFDL